MDDLVLFLAVADAGGLAGASRATGAAVPTLGRRMAALERDLGHRLFSRGKRGYALTLEGRMLLADAEPLRAVAGQLQGLARRRRGTPRVRITAGLWTTRFLAREVMSFWRPNDPWIPEFLASNADLDIARRAADIGVRNRRPTQSWLAGRRTGRIDFAVYGRAEGVPGYIATSEAASTPSERWLQSEHGEEIATYASDARVALDLALAGVGRIVMPVFAGEAEPGLARLGPPIAALAHEEWLVCHHDGRHDPPVRAALDALSQLLSDRSRRPMV
ncbi:MAG: LysR family transcriptional regulator [Pseudomonadota bacterium]